MTEPNQSPTPTGSPLGALGASIGLFLVGAFFDTLTVSDAAAYRTIVPIALILFVVSVVPIVWTWKRQPRAWRVVSMIFLLLVAAASWDAVARLIALFARR